MAIPPTVQGYTGLTQQTRLVLEPTPGEQVLLAQTTGAATLSLTTQPNALSPTTGMHLHFYVIGNVTTGSIVITGTKADGSTSQTSQTYHVAIAPQNNQGYTEFTTKEVWGTVGAGGIALTTLTPCQILVFGSYAGKYLLPITSDAEEKIAHFSPQDKRGILFKNFRVTQLTKGASIEKLDAALYPDSLWIPYMLIGPTPAVTTVPASPTSLLASSSVAGTMTLTTAPVAPGEFLIFTITGNTASGTIVLAGKDSSGLVASETIICSSAAAQTVYSTKRYSDVYISSPGDKEFATTGLTSSSIAVTGVYAWTYTWTYDGLTNLTPYSACLEVFDGVMGIKLPYTHLSEGTFDWQKEKDIAFSSKGEAQDYLVVGDPNPSTYPSGTNPFGTLAQPTALPMVSWPGSFYIDSGVGTPLTTQDGSLETFKLQLMTGRKPFYSGDGLQRWSNVTWESEPDFALDAEVVFQNYANYVGYFKQNLPLIFGASFRGTLLGSISSTTYYESVTFTLPAKVDTFKPDQSKNPVAGALKLMSEYNFSNLGYAYKCAWTAQIPPTYTA